MHSAALGDHHAVLRVSGLHRQVSAFVGGHGRCYRLQPGLGSCLLDRGTWRSSDGGALRQVRFAHRHDLDRTTNFFLKYGSITVFLARLLPVVRTFIALPAGIAKMPLLRFHIYTFLGSWPWCFVLAYVGMRLGRSWETDPRFKEVFHRFHLGVEVVLLVAIVWFVWSHWKQRTAAV